jgi:hypothetical protein
MATTKHRTTLLFERAVAELIATPCALLPYDYVELHNAAVRCVDVDGCSPSQFSVLPVPCGRALLQVPTVGAVYWWESLGAEWYGRDESMTVVALAYIAHHGRDKGRMAALSSKRSADMALLKFRLWLGLGCTTAQLKLALERLDAAVDAVFPDEPGKAPKDERGCAAIWGDTIARLCGAYHNIDVHRAAFMLSPVEAYSALVHAPTPFGQSKPQDDPAFSRYAAFRELVTRLKKERACSA